MDWLADARWRPLLSAVADRRIAMLPSPAALIPQSKAFVALLWELREQGFFPPTEAAAVTRYVARTTLDARVFGQAGYVIKPYLEREGRGVRFSGELSARERRRVLDAPVVYQERLDVARARIPVATRRGWKREARHLIFGVFLTGGEIAGIYTRAGARITGREAVYVPTLVRRGG
jgi:glutathionylspermidine synthase